MYSYMGQGSPAVLEYQYGTERYVRDDRFLSGIGVETFNPYPQVHRQPQNDPQLHRQNIQKSGMMPMQKGQANLFPVQGKGQSYASSNLDSYITDKHSSTHNFSELESLGYLRNTNTDEDQIKMLYRMGKFKDVQVKRYVYRIFDNGLIQIISPSPFMVGRIISEQKRPKLYHSILKSIEEQYTQQYSGIGSKLIEGFRKRKEKRESRAEGIANLQEFLNSDFNTQLTKFKDLPESVKIVFLQQLKNIGYQELADKLTNPFARFQNASPTQKSSLPLTSTSPFAKEEESNQINKYLLIGGSIVGAVVLYKLISK